jgi:hypothetical protein
MSPLEKEELIINKMVVQNTLGAYKCSRELMLQGFNPGTSSHLQTRVATKWMIIRSSHCKVLHCIKRIKKSKKLPHLEVIPPFVKKMLSGPCDRVQDLNLWNVL